MNFFILDKIIKWTCTTLEIDKYVKLKWVDYLFEICFFSPLEKENFNVGLIIFLLFSCFLTTKGEEITHSSLLFSLLNFFSNILSKKTESNSAWGVNQGRALCAWFEHVVNKEKLGKRIHLLSCIRDDDETRMYVKARANPCCQRWRQKLLTGSQETVVTNMLIFKFGSPKMRRK